MYNTCILLVISILTFPIVHTADLSLKPAQKGLLDTLAQGVTHLTNFVQDTFNAVFGQTTNQTNITISEDANLNITQMAMKYGYPIEEHVVITEDGFIINVHRIPYGRNNVSNGVVAFLMHGLIESSESWVLQGPDKALAYILADEGFDVWMGNQRGNKHAKKHTALNPDQKEFWDFSWEEIGIYDLPSTIDYILNVTNQEKVYYVGYSQGTTSSYVLNSLKPQYNQKIKIMFSLAPVAFMEHVKSPLIKMFSPASDFVAGFLSNYNVMNTEFLNLILDKFCGKMGLTCNSILQMIVGQDSKFLNESLSVLLGHVPTTASTLQLAHYGQLVQSGRFCQFDYGEGVNVDTYGNSTPPDYDLEKVTVPNIFFYGGNDWLADPADVETLMTHLPNVYDVNYIEDFNHLDLMYAPTAKDEVYSKIVKYIFDYENGKIHNVSSTFL